MSCDTPVTVSSSFAMFPSEFTAGISYYCIMKAKHGEGVSATLTHTHKHHCTHILTMNGCDIDARMDFSLLTCSTCFSRITSAIVIIFKAKNARVGRSRANTTRPNVPVPVVGGEMRVWEDVGGGRVGGSENGSVWGRRYHIFHKVEILFCMMVSLA